MPDGQLIKALRQIRKIPQTTVAEKLETTQQSYSKIEKRRYIKKEMLKKILVAINCSAEDFEKIKNFLPTLGKT